MEEENTLLELSKLFVSEVTEVNRSEINPAAYNPRVIGKEERKALKRSLKRFGCLGGIIVNRQTGNTIVGGHQKVDIMDEMYGYPDKDYKLRVEMIDVDLQTEKTINVALNNVSITGSWDYDKMREIVPDINYKDAGLTEADLNIIGVDFLLQTEGEDNLRNELDSLQQPLRQEADALREARKAQREAMKAQQATVDSEDEDEDEDNEPDNEEYVFNNLTPEEVRQAKIDHMKEVKQKVKENAIQNAQNMDAYVMLSFDNWEAKAQFCQRFGYDPYIRFIKGEVFDEQVERIE